MFFPKLRAWVLFVNFSECRFFLNEVSIQLFGAFEKFHFLSYLYKTDGDILAIGEVIYQVEQSFLLEFGNDLGPKIGIWAGDRASDYKGL